MRILLVEDNDDLAFGLRRTLEGEGYDVAVAADGPSGIRAALDARPDLVILDVMLPGVDGFGVLRALRERGMTAPVLMLTARGDETDKVHGFGLGADDYVTKPFGLSELVARVGALLRRARPAEPPNAPNADGADETLGFDDVVIDPRSRVVTRGGERVALTPKEFDLLLTFVRRPGEVLSRVSLLRDVWGHAADVLTRTVDIHVAELRRKLERVPAHPRHLVTVWKAGYRFDP
ncbi:response regulator receiver [Gemmatirosa kalamazoonensis]|uniref:Phosphate regulon transcriptional regulatory protein PhoB n=1 Tax=Gemmatirosa kalamazoonensis TaxID=861299 RepID=W0RHQ2_9BACT|nr:response regulator transcription factor [Gemmatirosa kalamazoonensis]AHG88933.1 response regulator receiver [Gemmatirosa kalamazoonensis]